MCNRDVAIDNFHKPTWTIYTYTSHAQLKFGIYCVSQHEKNHEETTEINF